MEYTIMEYTNTENNNIENTNTEHTNTENTNIKNITDYHIKIKGYFRTYNINTDTNTILYRMPNFLVGYVALHIMMCITLVALTDIMLMDCYKCCKFFVKTTYYIITKPFKWLYSKVI